jgi:hypothetical protein
MKRNLILLLMVSFSFIINAQDKSDKELEYEILEKETGITDRAGGTHNASNIGLFFENRGKLYPRRITQGPSGEFPINSTKHYIYRINPMVGIPGNVIQGRYTTNEEWEAAYGYHNRDLAQIAFSDNPATWHPVSGWPVKDADGNPIIKSDQDSYCVYNDSNNTVKVLGIEVHQIGYAYGIEFAKNMIVYTYRIINKSSSTYNDLYFNIYFDCDIGNVSGGVPEYSDDRLGFNKEKNLVYIYDDGVSEEWPDGTTGFMGYVFLKTPEVNGTEPGITDMHYNVYNDDIDIDSVQYGIMSSDPNLYNSSLGPRYFHLGSHTSLHFDDPETIPASGLDLLANIASGPYILNPDDTLTFITAIVAGESLEQLIASTDQAYEAMNLNFELAKPPARPVVYGAGQNNRVLIYWDDNAESSIDPLSQQMDFEGYRVYRSQDRGLTWKELAEFDLINTIGANRGLQYSYSDTTVINGFEYWYTVTAYDRGGEGIDMLESPKGNTLDAVNTIAATPLSAPLGRIPVSAGSIEYIGTDPEPTNYFLEIEPLDDESLADNQYEIGFTYVLKKESGDLATKVSYQIYDSSLTKPFKYGIHFTSPSTYNVLNLLTDEIIGREDYNYPSGGRSLRIDGHGLTLTLSDSAGTPPEKLPDTGDLITISFSIFALNSQGDTLISPHPLDISRMQATSDGVLFRLNPPEIIQSVSRVGGIDNIDITFSVDDENLIETSLYLISVEENGFDSSNEGFVSLSVRDTGIVLRVDTLYSGESFSFKGIEATVIFQSSAPPSAGNIFSIEVLKPELPGIKDRFRFTLKGSSTNQTAIKENINKIKVVPNPYVVSSLYEPEFGELRNEPLRQIQFINLPSECTIYIFTVDGDLVKTLVHSSTSGTKIWDLRSESGREIAPGIYIYVVQAGNTEFIERFAVIK